MFCVFDCETVPDCESLREIFGFEGDDKEISLQAFAEQKERTGYEFLPVNLHKLVALSAVIGDDNGNISQIYSKSGDEEEILEGFLKFIQTKTPRLISYNGRGFDLPMIMIRAMKYNLSCPIYYAETDYNIPQMSKWNCYRTRYSTNYHMDLMDHISEFRAVSGLNLNSLCKSLGIPGKYDVSGDQVLELYYNKEIDKICEYCESDVINTYFVFLKYELLRGKILPEDYTNLLINAKEILAKKKREMGYFEVFTKFIDNETEKIKNRIEKIKEKK